MADAAAGAAADYFDAARRPPSYPVDAPANLVALCGGAISRDQARFLVHVMYLGGLFTAAQAEAWLAAHVAGWGDGRDADGRCGDRQRFLESLFLPRWRGSSLAETRSLAGGAARSYAHCACRKVYEAVGIPHSRYRRRVSAQVAMQRLLVFDFILDHHDGWAWYGASRQKLDLFGALGVPVDLLPQRVYTNDAGQRTQRFFVDHLPIGVRGWKLVFPFAFCEDRTAAAAVARLDPYKPLWSALRAQGLCVHVVVVGQVADAPEWRRRLAAFEELPGPGDRRRLFDRVETYLLERFLEAGDAGVRRAYGGGDAAQARVRSLKAGFAESPSGDGVMSLTAWRSERFSSHAWLEAWRSRR